MDLKKREQSDQQHSDQINQDYYFNYGHIPVNYRQFNAENTMILFNFTGRKDKINQSIAFKEESQKPLYEKHYLPFS